MPPLMLSPVFLMLVFLTLFFSIMNVLFLQTVIYSQSVKFYESLSTFMIAPSPFGEIDPLSFFNLLS